MNLAFVLLTFYSSLCEYYQYFAGFGMGVYNYLEMTVLNETFTQVHFYDYSNNQKHIIRDNHNIFMVMYLMFLKYVMMIDIYNIVHMKGLSHKIVHLLELDGCFELNYFKNGKNYKYLTRESMFDVDIIVHNLCQQKNKSLVFATLNDKIDITKFMNDHLSSFNKHTDMTLRDVMYLNTIGAKTRKPILEKYFLKYMDDATCEEVTIFKENAHIIIN